MQNESAAPGERVAVWDAAARGWDARYEWYARQLAPVADWLVRASAAQAGSRVLDVGCGSGLPALDLAAQVRPGGRVTAVDLSPEMLRAVERRAGASGLDALTVRQMDAEHLAFIDASFDAVTAAFVLMFCPDPVRAVSEMRRVLVPGGRCAIVVWDVPPLNPFLTTVGAAMAAVDPDPAEEDDEADDAPGPFRFAAPGALESLVRAAGFPECTVQSIPFIVECASLDEYWRTFLDMAAGVRQIVEAMPAERVQRVRDLVGESVGTAPDEPVRLQGTVLCAIATAPWPPSTPR